MPRRPHPIRAPPHQPHRPQRRALPDRRLFRLARPGRRRLILATSRGGQRLQRHPGLGPPPNDRAMALAVGRAGVPPVRPPPSGALRKAGLSRRTSKTCRRWCNRAPRSSSPGRRPSHDGNAQESPVSPRPDDAPVPRNSFFTGSLNSMANSADLSEVSNDQQDHDSACLWGRRLPCRDDGLLRPDPAYRHHRERDQQPGQDAERDDEA